MFKSPVITVGINNTDVEYDHCMGGRLSEYLKSDLLNVQCSLARRLKTTVLGCMDTSPCLLFCYKELQRLSEHLSVISNLS